MKLCSISTDIVDLIKINFSQYADDTTPFIAPEENSLRECMQVLNEFHDISGLQINVEKNNVVKIGAWRDKGTTFCRDLDLWTNKFTSLGIQFDVNNMLNITNLNIRSRIGDIKSLIRIWSPRFLTPIGKITIIESLLLSKITLVLLFFPTPAKSLMEEIDRMFKHFLWDKKLPKF